MKKIDEMFQRELEYAHLGLDFDKINWEKLRNPLSTYHSAEYYTEILKVIRDPKNFYFTCKYILNLEVPPIQLVCLEELWNRPFPMLIATRGFGKTWLLAMLCLLRLLITQGCRVIVTSASFRQAKFVFDYMETIINNAPVYKDLTKTIGVRKSTDMYKLKVGDSIAMGVPLGDGCCKSNTMLTLRQGFISIGDLFGSVMAENQIKHQSYQIWGNGNFNESDNQLYNGYKSTKIINSSRNYTFEATDNHKIKVLRNQDIIWSRIDKIVCTDYVLIDRSNRWHDGSFKCTPEDAYTLGALIGDGCWTNQYKIGLATGDLEILDNVNKSFTKKFIKRDKYHYMLESKTERLNWLNQWNLKKCYTIDKYLPDTILSASQECMTECLKGLFDSDGSVSVITDKRGGYMISLTFWNTSEKLVDQIRYILLHYGIISTKNQRQRKNPKWNKEYSILISGKDVRIFADKIGFKLKRKQDILLKGLEGHRDVSIKDIIPNVLDKMISVSLKYQKVTKGNINVTSARLKKFKHANRKLVDLFIDRYGQCDIEFTNKLLILSNSDIYYDLVTNITDSNCDTFDVHIPITNEYCGNGFYSHNSKIRGYRANYIIAEEFSAISPSIFEEVISGFAASASSPIENMKRLAQIKKLKEKGMWTTELAQEMEGTYRPNQVILCGTASWDFNHFAKYWREYKAIINSKGNQEELHSVMGNKWSPDLSWTDYSIIRIPLELIPEGMMDDKNIARAKAGTSTGIADNEYHCFDGQTEIITDSGLKFIKDIIVGDKVLTHRGRFQSVVDIGKRFYTGIARKIISEGNNQPIIVTPTHEFYSGYNQWNQIDNLEFLTQSKLLELSNVSNVNLSDYLNEFHTTNIDGVDYLYAKIYNRKDHIDKSVKNTIKVDYYFGIIMGYYASEGSTSGANLRTTSFALDGHVNQGLELYVEELLEAIYTTFSKSARVYKEGNVARVVLHSVIITKFIKKICPGISDTKFINPDILYSNEEFMRGFIRSYWRGNGTISKYENEQVVIKAACTNKGLLCQVKNCMSYFGIRSNLNNQGRIAKIKPLFTLSVPKFYHNSFFNLVSDSYTKQKNSIDHFHYKIEKIEHINYEDFVYNIQVQEDSSYSLINSSVKNCIFSKDSNGFFPRRLVESCICKKPILLPDGPVQFTASMNGNANYKYVMGVDPASESDNFSLVILELHNNHRRLVYCWTTTRKRHYKKFKDKKSGENYFYGYINQKIRSLMKVFPIEYISIDSGGGGIEVMGVLHDLHRLETGDTPIWPMVKDNPLRLPDNKDYGYDDEFGLHIIEMVSMSKNSYVVEANHGLKQDLENKTLLFPLIDAISFMTDIPENPNEEDEAESYDTAEDLYMEILELYEELSSITHTTTPNGTDRWETPPIILSGGKKDRMRKDRYSSLLYANALARRMMKTTTITYSDKVSGGFIHDFKNQNHSGQPLYNGPAWWSEPSKNTIYGIGISRNSRN